MLAKLDIPSSSKEIPDDTLFWPEEGDETINAFVITKRRNIDHVPSFGPSSFGFTEKLHPFLILKTNDYLFFKSAGAMRLYLRISSRLR